MTLAHDASASGGLRVPFSRSEVQAPAKMNHQSLHSFTSTAKTQGYQNSEAFEHDKRSTLLATALTRINSTSGTHQLQALIDPGSQITFIAEHIATLLKLKKQYSSITISGIGGGSLLRSRGQVSCTLNSLSRKESISITAQVLKRLFTSLPTYPLTQTTWPHIQNLELADPTFHTPQKIDIILGADYYGRIMLPNIIYGTPGTPTAQLSIFGWLLLGPVSISSKSTLQNTLKAKISHDDSAVQDLLTKFWIQEEIPSTQQTFRSPEDQRCEEHFKTTHQRHSTGRYIVRLPLKAHESTLGNSFYTAKRCLIRQLNRLTKDPEYNRLYTQFMQEYESLGHMVKLKPENQHSIQYFLPHHGVLRPSSTTTKLRVVFNGSSPTSTGVSLNDISYTGEKIQLDITDVLLWVRAHKLLFATDITKMYRQIMVHPDDWHLQQILWVDDQQKPTPFQLTTVTYGTRSAPYLAVRVLLQLVEDEGEKYPLASQAVTKGRYVDDIFGRGETPEELLQVATELQDLCKAGGFPLAKWNSNNSDILKTLFNSENQSKPIAFEDCNTKILGLNWNPTTDSFNFTTKPPQSGSKITKCLILSETAQIFDPLGLVSPATVRAKMLLQDLWRLNLGWDGQVLQSIQLRWTTIREDLNNLKNLSIPRWINSTPNSTCELHGFSDASELAMAAAIYLKIQSSSTGPKITLLCSKTKVAPIKALTVPRLELTAALMLAKLTKYVQTTLPLNITETHLWTDSHTTLSWIKTHASSWKDFVRNRVLQIQDLVPHAHWRHIPGKDNPADCASRGTTSTQLLNHHLWWTGPTWLTKSKNHWPNSTSKPNQAALQKEARPGNSFVMTTLSPTTQWDLIYKYSSLSKLLHMTAISMKVIAILKKAPNTSSKLTIWDLEKARKYWIKSTQAAYFVHELRTLSSDQNLPPNNPLTRLTAFIDSEGILRVGGRLQNSLLDPEGKHPAILPRHSPFTTLVISNIHSKTLHGGIQLTLSTLRQQYWIIGGRQSVKSHILKCVDCARQRGVRAQQLMGQLPHSRVTPTRPFYYSGVDYAGPITIKTWEGKNAKQLKAWICVFVCMSSSAVHLEVVSDCSTEGFLAAYRRFISRRGITHTLFSDCGRNFLGASSEIKKLFTQHTEEFKKLNNYLVTQGTQWSFNPPAAPHMGGKWESVVKSIKFHLHRTIKELLLTFEQFSTLLTQIEALLNSRPLEPLSDDPDDLSALTPGHFLIGEPLTSLPESSITEVYTTRINKWRLIQQRTQYFWSRWSQSYLQKLQAITKWFHKRNNLQPGALVLLTDERFPPSKWPLARILTLHPGPDGLARVATIKTATTTLTRPITKLALLPINPETDNQLQSNEGQPSNSTGCQL